jgi:hypothetical protein
LPNTTATSPPWLAGAELLDDGLAADAEGRRHAGLVAVAADDQRHLRLLAGAEGGDDGARQGSVAHHQAWRQRQLRFGQLGEALRCNRPQLRCAGACTGQAERVGQLDADSAGLVARMAGQATGALRDAAAEQSARGWRGHQRQHALRTRGLAEHRHALWVTAEGSDVGLHPAQCGDLIEQAEVGRGPCASVLGPQRGMHQEAERAEAAVQRHGDDTAPRQRAAVVDRQVLAPITNAPP